MLSTFIERVENELNIARGSLAPDTPLESIRELDSLGRVTLLVMMDASYGVYVEPQQIDACANVGDLFGLVERKAKAA